MGKFLIKVFIFACFIFAVDSLAGVIFPKLVAGAKGGDNWRNNYICEKADEDILIYGSSRAIHHYNPTIMTDSLGMSCYNCGQDGNGIILNYGRFEMIRQHHVPKVVIYDALPEFDLKAGDDNHKYLNWLKAYYDNNGIPQIFESIDKTEKYKMMSNLYKYNSRFVQIISDCIRPQLSSGINGFRPLNGEMDSMKISRKETLDDEEITFDSLKLHYWNKLISQMGRCRLIVVISPTWNGMKEREYEPLLNMCKNNDLPFINFANDPKYMHNYTYFKDGGHLNSHGAEEFTRDLVTALKKRGYGQSQLK